ncbi:hypothetical protein AAFP30_23975 [Gordonia sp. CPCC 205515]|uniref:hypothetical protein n=1 Tax=Gordonia sp. CPCC 205515 TaxID=3140791 RepID=UPI003AF3EE46
MTPDNTIPEIDTAQDPIGSTEDLRQRWRALMGPLGFSEALLWFAFIDPDHRLIPQLNQLPLPDEPDPMLTSMLMTRLGEAIDDIPGVTVACLITRPGSDGLTEADCAWARVLTDLAARHGVPMHPVHRANDLELVTLTMAIDKAA